MEKKNDNIESQSKYGHKMIDELMNALLKCLRRHDGEIYNIKNAEILRLCDITQAAFEYYYKDPEGIVDEIYQIIGNVFSDLEQEMTDVSDTGMLLTIVFERLGKLTAALEIISILGEIEIWKTSRSFLRRIAKNWNQKDEKTWEYVFDNFCFQFGTILRKWSEEGYSSAAIPECVRLVEVWIDVDGMISDAISLKSA